MTKMQWTTRRVVVEVPVNGDYSEKDLRWDVERLVAGAKLNQRAIGRIKRVKFGAVSVKTYAMVEAYARRKPKTLLERVEALERQRN